MTDKILVSRKTLEQALRYLTPDPSMAWVDFDKNGDPRTARGLLLSNLRDALQQPVTQEAKQ